MDYPALRQDLGARGYTAASDPQQVATAVGTLTVSTVGVVPTSKVLIWLAGNGILGTIEDLSGNAQSPLRSAALAVIYAASGGAPGLDLSDAKVAGMLEAFVAAGVVTQPMADALTALATTTAGYVQATYSVPALTAADVIVAFGGQAVTFTPEPA